MLLGAERPDQAPGRLRVWKDSDDLLTATNLLDKALDHVGAAQT